MKGHSYNGRCPSCGHHHIISRSTRNKISQYMKKYNPMKDPIVVAKAMKTRKDRGYRPWSFAGKGKKRLAEINRKRMLIDNPMKNPETRKKISDSWKKKYASGYKGWLNTVAGKRKISKIAKKRMLTDNPMKYPVVVEKVVETKRKNGFVPYFATEDGKKKLAKITRRRMAVDNPFLRPEIIKKARRTFRRNGHCKRASERMKEHNPMHNESSLIKCIKTKIELYGSPYGALKPSKPEKFIISMIDEHSLPIIYNAMGGIPVGRRVPDFLVKGQRKCIEVTEYKAFNRDFRNYGNPTKNYYRKLGWKCKVIMLRPTTEREEVLSSLRGFVLN